MQQRLKTVIFLAAVIALVNLSPVSRSLAAQPPDGPLPAGCGAGYDQSTCGNVGDPYEGQGAPKPNATITACGVFKSPSNGYVYRVTRDIGSDPTQDCITFSYTHTFVLDLNRHTVTGKIHIAVNPYGLNIMNGTVNCNDPAHACVQVNEGSTPTTYTKIHHLTINQAAVAGYCLRFVHQNVGTHVPTRYIQVYNIDGSVANVSTLGRHNWIQILGAVTATAEVWNCTISPGGYADQFQGIGVWTIGAYVHNNYIVLPRPLYEIGTYQTDRAIEFDCVGKTEDTCGHNELAYNQIVADNNRAIRVRADTGDLIHDNVIQNCRVTATNSGCIMIGGADVYDNATSAGIYNNTIEINAGEGILVVGSSYSTANIHDNTVTCYQGDCSHVMWFATTTVRS